MAPEAKSIQDRHVVIETQPVDEPGRPVSGDRKPLRGDWTILGGLAFLLFFIHVLVNGRYGYFRR